MAMNGQKQQDQEQTPLVLPDGLLSFAETEVLQAALRVFLFSVERLAPGDDMADMKRLIEELDHKIYRHREKLWTTQERDTVIFLAPTFLDKHLEEQVTAMRLFILERVPGLAKRMSEFELLPPTQQTLDAFQAQLQKRVEDSKRESGMNDN
ncbi:MAG: hypothetical protein U0641_05600 [Anaerolineae bacterium]